jgi:hydroxymethylpyrimidine pyrophosphatase-like HAD family hydrolase
MSSKKKTGRTADRAEQTPGSTADRCLIAADVDNTIVAQGDPHNREAFLLTLGPCLLDAARLGAHLALLTGNNMDALTSRVLRWLIEQLCLVRDLGLLSHFHFFCSAAGVYAHFPRTDPDMVRLCARVKPCFDSTAVLQALTKPGTERKKLAIRPRFIDPSYIGRTAMSKDEAKTVRSILEECAASYMKRLVERRAMFERTYDLSHVSNGNGLIPATPELRTVEYGSDAKPDVATVQITLKPVVSFRHARNPLVTFGQDLRSELIAAIQARLDAEGLGYCVARAGGRASIDVTLEKLDKAYALEFLIDRLNLQGQAREGRKLGSNTIYFGDEVIVGGGNDYPVTRIPGLLVFAVNPDRELVPCLHHVLVPSAILEGPDATGQIVAKFSECARRLSKGQTHKNKGQSALDLLKEEILSTRVIDRLEKLKADSCVGIEDWQALHAFVSLMSRTDPSSREWLRILTTELDAIMGQLTKHADGLP